MLEFADELARQSARSPAFFITVLAQSERVSS